jgi:hypothetical protein
MLDCFWLIGKSVAQSRNHFWQLLSFEPVSKFDIERFRRREENQNSQIERHDANELPRVFPSPHLAAPKSDEGGLMGRGIKGEGFRSLAASTFRKRALEP